MTAKVVSKKRTTKKVDLVISDEESDSSSSEEENSNNSSETSSSDEDEEPNKVPLKKRKNMQKASSSSSDEKSSDDESNSDDKGREFFTDENVKWLKPKNTKNKKSQLLSSDDEEQNDDDDDDELLEVERQAQQVDEEMELEQQEARDEYQRMIAQSTAKFHLPTVQELEDDQDRVVPPSELRERIEGILEVLADFKTRRQTHRSRGEYMDQLVADMAELHGYLPELMAYIVSMLGPSEAWEFVMASDATRPLVVRTNTLKVRRKDLAASLMKRGVTLDPLASWSKVGLLIQASNIPIGATPEYLSGQYMLQSAASMCPVLALDPQRNQKVLDMSAAPGGKTSYMAQLMANTGYIVANDLKADRQKATVANMHRLGVKNVMTSVMDGRKLGIKFPNKFDRVLLDAPCSGLGVISRDASVKVQRTMADINRTAHLQKELLLSAIDALNPKAKGGGFMVYSTCSVAVAENEEVVHYALTKRNIKIVPAGLEFGKPGFTRYQNKRFHPSVALTRRFYPHVHNMDGFFVARIQKLNGPRQAQELVTEEDPVDEETEKMVDGKQAVSAKPSKEVTKKNKHGKKKRGATEKDPREAKKPRNNLSVPPPSNDSKKKKKTKQNAKTMKPRRLKTQKA